MQAAWAAYLPQFPLPLNSQGGDVEGPDGYLYAVGRVVGDYWVWGIYHFYNKQYVILFFVLVGDISLYLKVPCCKHNPEKSPG